MTVILPAALILFLLATLFKISFIYTVSYVLFGVYLLATLWSARVLHDVRFRRRCAPRALHGDDVEVVLEIENRGWFPVPWMQIHERLPVALSSPPFFRSLVSLGPRETRRFRYLLHCRQRGWYQIGPLTVSLGDVFGLSARQGDVLPAEHLTVYPRILPIDELGFPSKSPFGQLRTPQILYEDPARVIGVRDYQVGDSPRRINWKVSASSGRLQVRKLEPAMTLEAVILLNVDTSDYTRQYAYAQTELAIEVAASLANHLVGLRQEVGLLTNGVDPIGEPVPGLVGYLPRKGRSQLTIILDLLGRLVVVNQRPFCLAVRGEMKRLPWGATLIIITSHESPELLETVLPLRRAGYNVVVIYMDYPNPEVFEEAQHRAALLGLRAYRIWREGDVDIWQQHIRTVV